MTTAAEQGAQRAGLGAMHALLTTSGTSAQADPDSGRRMLERFWQLQIMNIPCPKRSQEPTT